MPLIKRELPLPASTFSLRDVNAQAEMILAQARVEASRILAEARKEAEVQAARHMQDARARGLADGQREGREQTIRESRDRVLKDTRAQFAGLEKSLIDLVGKLEQQKHALIAEAESGLIQLAWAIARRVCKTLAANDPAVAAANARTLLLLVGKQRDVVLTFNPEDLRELPHVAPELHAHLQALQHVRVVDDAALQRGDSVVTTSDGRIDASIDQQLDAIATALTSKSEPAAAVPDASDVAGAEPHVP